MKRLFSYLTTGLLLLPLVTLAQGRSSQGGDPFGDVSVFFKDAAGFINGILIPILLALAFLVFIVGVAKFFFLADKDNADSKKEGRQLMIWGILAFVVIVSIWGIVTLIVGSLGLDTGELRNIPITPIGT